MDWVGAGLSVAKFVATIASQDASCRELATQAEQVVLQLESISGKIKVTDTDGNAEAFRLLKDELDGARTIISKSQKLGYLKSIFKAKELYEELKNASDRIQLSLGSVALLQFAKVQEIEKAVTTLKEELPNLLSAFVTDRSELIRQQQNEVLREILKHEKKDQLDGLLSWISKNFNVEVETVRTEWQSMKNMATNLKSSKIQTEEMLLQQIIFSLECGNADCRKDPVTCPTSESGSKEPTISIDHIQRCVKDISSGDPLKVWNGFQELLPVATTEQGRVAIIKSGVVELLTEFLRNETNTYEAATLLGYLTASTLMDQNNISSTMVTLVSLLIKGTCGLEARVKIAGALTGIFKVPGVIEYTLAQQGIISSLVALGKDGVKALARLARIPEVDNGSHFLVLSRSDIAHVAEESLSGFLSFIYREPLPGVMLLRTTAGIPALIRTAVNASGGSAQETSMLILEQFAKYSEDECCIDENFGLYIPQLVEQFRSLNRLPILRAVMKLSTCFLMRTDSISQQPYWSDKIDLLTSLVRSLLESSDVVESIVLLRVLFCKFEACKQVVLENAATSKLLEALRYGTEATRLIRTLLQVATFQRSFVMGNGIERLKEHIEHCKDQELIEVIAALAILGENNRYRGQIVELKLAVKLASLLHSAYSVEVKMAAEELIFSLVSDEGNHLELLADLLPAHGNSLARRLKAGTTMLKLANPETAAQINKCLPLLVTLAREAGAAGRDFTGALIRFVADNGNADAEGLLPMLLKAFKVGEQAEVESAVKAITRLLVDHDVFSSDVVRKSDYEKVAIDHLSSDTCSDACVADIARSAIVLSSGSSFDLITKFTDMLCKDGTSQGKREAAAVFLAHQKLKSLTPKAVKPLVDMLSAGGSVAQALKLLDFITQIKTPGKLSSDVDKELARCEQIAPKLIELLKESADHTIQELAIRILTTLPSYESRVALNSMVSKEFTQAVCMILCQRGEKYRAAIRRSAFLIYNLAPRLKACNDKSIATETVKGLKAGLKEALENTKGFHGTQKSITDALHALATPSFVPCFLRRR